MANKEEIAKTLGASKVKTIEEPSDPRVVTYCSFATDECCLGVCILVGEMDPTAASRIAWWAGINPGGQILISTYRETDRDIPPQLFESLWSNRNRLISVKEARNLFGAKSLRELEDEGKLGPAPSSEMLDLARRASQQPIQDVEAWAAKLAEDVAEADD